ncbi:recombinase family protein [Nonomuraea sp. SBT364]|uniref:recombinase family protein n=1 Tax=Nonomuraea sp. SBT364 TaxID=1580530 RepID=UPI000A7B12CB|nr:recombinase family protein [Nonomuraea sp. SBT364]
MRHRRRRQRPRSATCGGRSTHGVSTADQIPDHQIDALIRAGVDLEHTHLDRASGAKASRPELDLVLQLLREGDTLKVTRLDRLSRSVLHLVTLGADLRTRKIGMHVIEQGIDTETTEGRAMFEMLSVLAEPQRELIVANTVDGWPRCGPAAGSAAVAPG